jgi:hypothetical protein
MREGHEGSISLAYQSDGAVALSCVLPAGFLVATLDSEGDVGWSTSITTGADGLGLISYQGNGDLKVAHCADTACSTATLATLDSDGIVGTYTSITTGADGLPLISYYDGTNGDLKVVHCADAACLVR